MTKIHFRPCRLFILIALLLVMSASALAGVPPQSIKVVLDNNYPPYVFQDDQGRLQGILVDQWRLWEEKTGIKVEISAMDWAKAISRMQAGDFDVIDTIFKTEERSVWLDFSRPDVRIEVPIFFNKDIAGITDIASLKGFVVATKAGDAAVELLKQSGIDNLLLFDSYEAVIRAAAEHKVNVFVVDKPPALYFLYKFNLQDQFKYSAPINVGEFHRAVRKGRGGLLQVVEEGFGRLSVDERQKIEDRWSGASLTGHIAVRYFLFAAGSLGLLVMVLFAWNRLLRKLIEARTADLQASEQRFQTIYNSVNEAIFIHDMDTGAILDVNQRMSEMFGYSREEACSIPVEGLSAGIPPYSQAEAVALMTKAAQGTPQLFEWLARHRNGTLFWVEGNMRRARIGVADRILVTVRDVAGRKRTEKALQESESRYRLLFESAGDAILIMKDEIILDCNEKALELFGCYGRGQIVGASVVTFSADKQLDDRPVSELAQEKILAALHGETQLFSWKHKRCTGEPIETEVTLNHLDLGEGGNLLAIIRDVTTQKQSELQLRQAQKMESIGTLAGGIAHDFNNILNAIIGYTDLAKLRGTEEHLGLQDYLHQVSKAANRAANLVRQILTFSRKQQQEKAPLQISLIVKEALKLLRASIPSTIEIRQEIIAQGAVLADATQIHQLVMNLCTNAYHAMLDRGGVLGVSLKEMATDQEMVYPEVDLPAGRYVTLTVSDSGCGMDQETMARIFDPYFTTKDVGKGTGLGLAVVHGIVQDHQGRIVVYSEPGHGATFTVYLPMIMPEGAVADLSEEETPVSTGHERVMVVDDEGAIRNLVSQFLTQAGYRVEAFVNGKEAWQALSASPDEWDLLVTDQTMPEMTGEQLTAKAQTVRPDLPIILCSGYNTILGGDRAKEAGVFAALQKPVSRNTLLAHVAKALAGKS